jgi:hypothetical protein
MKRHIYCFAHRQMAEAQALALRLPALEDANAIQVGLMRIQKALIEGTISTKTAGLLLYSMQLALQNVGRTTFGQVKAEEPVREVETVDPLTTEETEDAEEGRSLPLMHADGRRFEEVEWKPTPDLYRSDTREGMEAYEAWFRMRVAPKTEKGSSSPYRSWRPTLHRDPSTHTPTRRSALGTPFSRRHLLRALRLAQDDKGIEYRSSARR